MNTKSGSQGSAKSIGREPFYFKSFNRVIGIAHDLEELRSEFNRLLGIDQRALEYHLREGHIVQWLTYIGEDELAARLTGVGDPRTAYEVISSYVMRSGRTMDDKEPSVKQERRYGKRNRNARMT